MNFKKNYLKLSIFFLLLLLFSNFSFANPICVYNPDSQEIDFSVDGSTRGEEINLGNPKMGKCDYEQFAIEDTNGICYETVLGFNIYNHTKIIKSIADKTSIDITNQDKYKIIQYKQDCGNNLDADIEDIKEIEINDYVIEKYEDSGKVIVKDDIPSFVIDKDENYNNEFRECQAQISIFDLEDGKSKCEGNNKCIYNPNSENFLKSKNACIPKKAVLKCLDYKTQNVCQANSAKSNSPYLEGGCRWIQAKEYNSSFLDKRGMCISNFFEDEKRDVNIIEYEFRENPIEDSSFENTDNNKWQNIKEENLNSDYSHSYSKSYNLEKDVSIFQEISFLHKSKFLSKYYPKIYVKTLNLDPNQNIELKLKIEEFDLDNKLINTSSSTKKISISKIFNGYNFNDFIKSDDAYHFKISLTSNSNDILIDSFSFSKYRGKEIFLTEEHKKASNCEYCSDENGANDCNIEKAKYLGSCSYMENNDEENFKVNHESPIGDNNKYLDDDKKYSQKNQVLANSQIFCELFVTQNSCENINSFINLNVLNFHPFSGSGLCSWNKEKNACYKVSNLLEKKYNSNIENCDIVPPNLFLYFKGFDKNLKEISISSKNSSLIGSPSLTFDLNDFKNIECKYYDEVKNLIGFNISVYQNKTSKKVSKVFEFESINLKEKRKLKLNDIFITSISNERLFNDGINKVEVYPFDSANNIGNKRIFEMNLDLSGPQINLTNLKTSSNNLIDSIISKSSVFEFEIKDISQIKSCNYNVKTKEKNYEKEILNIEGKKSFNISIKLDLDNPSPGQYSSLTFNCFDIFGQESKKTFHFVIDWNLEFSIFEANSLPNPQGYLRTKTLFLARSFQEIKSCRFDGFSDSDIDLDEIKISEERITIDGKTYNSKVSTYIDFSSNGDKQGKVICDFKNGKSVEVDLKYNYNNVPPKILSYEIKSISASQDIKNVLKIEDKYYVRESSTQNSQPIKLVVNSSVILNKENLGLEIIPETISNSDWSVNLENSDIKVENNKFEAVNFMDKRLYNGDNLIPEDNFFQQKYRVEFSDIFGRRAHENISFFYDTSEPELVFNGDISKKFDTKIFTNKEDPKIEISFNSPSYRLFTCEIEAKEIGINNVNAFFPLTSQSNNFSFNLLDISKDINLIEGKELPLTFTCKDNYDMEFKEELFLSLDQTPPKLKSIETNSEIYPTFIYEGMSFKNLSDEIFFNLEDTDESFYECSYDITTPSTLLDNNLNYKFKKIISNNNNLRLETDKILFLGVEKPKVLKSETSIFNRNNKFYEVIEKSILNENSVNIKVKISGSCQDRVNQKTQLKEKVITLGFVPAKTFFLDMTFEVENNYLKPIVITTNTNSIENGINSIFFTDDKELKNPLLTLEKIEDNNNLLDTFKVNSQNNGIDLDNQDIREGDKTYYAYVKDKNERVFSISKVFEIDKTPPEIDVDFLDIADDGFIYVKNVSFNLDVFDEKSSIKEINLKIDDVTTYKIDKNNLGGYKFSGSPDFLIDNPKKSFEFRENDRKYSGEFEATFKNTRDYPLMIEAKDFFDNEKEYKTEFKIRDGIGVILLDSDNSFVDNKKDIFTREKNPKIRFKTTKIPKECIMKIGSNEDNINNINSDDKVFEYDFSKEKLNLNLNEDNYESIFIISCKDNNDKNYDYTKKIEFVDFLPDYSLISEKGFLITNTTDFLFTKIKSNRNDVLQEIKCEYSFDNNKFNELSPKFSKILSFIELGENKIAELLKDSGILQSGNINIYIRCQDITKKYGHTKLYKFKNLIIDDNFLGNLSKVEFLRNNEKIKIYNNSIYFSDPKNYKIKIFDDENYDQCKYKISRNGFIGSITNIFKSSTELNFTDNYFESQSINLEDGNLRLICIKYETNFKRDINLKKLDSNNVNFDLSYFFNNDK